MDLSRFKSTIPEGWNPQVERKDNSNDIYLEIGLRKQHTIKVTKGIVCIAKSVIPPELRVPARMPTYSEMIKAWDHVNKELYDRLIEIKYHNA